MTLLSKYSRNIVPITINDKVPEDTDLIVLASDKAMAWNSSSMPYLRMPFIHKSGVDEALETFLSYNSDQIFDTIPVYGIGAGFLHCIHHLTGKIASLEMSNILCDFKGEPFYMDYTGTQFPIKDSTKYFEELVTTREQFTLAGISYNKMMGGTLWDPSIVEDYGVSEQIFKLLQNAKSSGNNSRDDWEQKVVVPVVI